MANEDKSTRYQRGRRRVAVWTVLVDMAVLAAAAWVGWRMQTEGAGVTGPAVPRTMLFVLGICVVRFLAILPLAYHAEVVLERRYQPTGASTTQWLMAFLGRLAQSAVLAVGAALVVQAAAWWAGPLWWAWATGVLAVAVVGAAYLVPAALARAATEVAPLGRPELEARLSALAVRVGVPAIQVLAWKAGRAGRTSAMLVGAGRSRRVLVAESVLDSHADDEIEVIVAHELAHSVRGDMWRSSALAVAAGAACFFVSARAVEVLDGALGIGAPGGLASLPLVGLACRGMWGALSPLANAMSRAQERRADRDALAWTQNAPALVRTLRRLGAAHLAEDRPSRLSGVLFGRHPPLAERIAAAEGWEREASMPNAQCPMPNRVRN